MIRALLACLCLATFALPALAHAENCAAPIIGTINPGVPDATWEGITKLCTMKKCKGKKMRTCMAVLRLADDKEPSKPYARSDLFFALTMLSSDADIVMLGRMVSIDKSKGDKRVKALALAHVKAVHEPALRAQLETLKRALAQVGSADQKALGTQMLALVSEQVELATKPYPKGTDKVWKKSKIINANMSTLSMRAHKFKDKATVTDLLAREKSK